MNDKQKTDLRCCKWLIWINVILFYSCAFTQTLPEYHNITTEFTKTVNLNYLLYAPPNYRPNEPWPLVLYLTGAECIDDINIIRQSGPPKAVESGMNYDYFIVAPQLPGDSHWDPDALNALLNEIQRDYNIDDSRCYITGIGDRGGWGVYEFCVSCPGIFKRVAPISATACTEICRMGDVSTWIFHGKQDEIVPVADAENMLYELEYYCETESQLTIYDSLGHEIWDRAYSEDGFWEWFIGSTPTFINDSAKATLKEFSKEVTVEIDDDYLLYLPKNYDNSDRDWPLMVFLHGAGSAIQNIDNIRQAGPPMLYEQGMDSDFVLICPQLYADIHWNVDRLYVLTQYIINTYKIDESRIYLTGLSRGGFGTWEFAVSYPDLFAAVVPISARDVPGVERLINTNVWIFHGAQDDGVPWQGSQFMYNRLNAVSANVQLTLFEGVGHWAWIPAYEMDSLWTWILSQENELVSVINKLEYINNFALEGNYPNPFNNSTTIRYYIPKTTKVTLRIHNINGHIIEYLVNHKQEPGFYSVNWDARNVSTGVYFYRIQAEGFQQVKKMLLIK